MDKRPLKVFLCHASADKPKVRELYRTLKRRGVQPWLDAEDLIPGQNWEVEIPKALLSSDAIIICLTPNSVDKEGYVQKEIKFALDKAMEMPEGRIFIIPARLEECELPFSLRQYQAVNLYEKTGYTKLMQALKLRASQLERATVELPKKGETTAEIKKVVEETKPPESKEEKPETKTPKPAQDKVGVGGDVKDSVIVSGSGNVINIGDQKKAEPEKPQPRKTKPPSKPNTAIIVALIGLAGTIIAALLGSPIIEQWFSPAPSATEMATVTATFTSRPVIPSQTVEPSSTPTRSPTFTPTPLPTEITDAKGVTMRLVPAGEFTMGSENGNSDEIPVHTVSMGNYYIDKYEITNSLYTACVESKICGVPHSWSNYGEVGFENYPIMMITWDEAQIYCQWRGAHLPTEAEWEKAARGTDERKYPWGDSIGCSDANFCTQRLFPVGGFDRDKSPYNVYDLAGNVSEWVYDWYDSSYYDYSEKFNPLGPDTGKDRVVRGGGYSLAGQTDTSAMLVSNRGYREPSEPHYYIGYRCAKEVAP